MSFENPVLIEPTPAPEFWVDGIHKVEVLGPGVFRFYCYRTKAAVCDPMSAPAHELVFTAIGTIEAARSVVAFLQALLADASTTEAASVLAAMTTH